MLTFVSFEDRIRSNYLWKDGSAMDQSIDVDQFTLLEEKINKLIELVGTQKKEREALAEKVQIQEERIADLTEELEVLRTSRDKAKQRIIALLERIEQIGL